MWIISIDDMVHVTLLGYIRSLEALAKLASISWISFVPSLEEVADALYDPLGLVEKLLEYQLVEFRLGHAAEYRKALDVPELLGHDGKWGSRTCYLCWTTADCWS